MCGICGYVTTNKNKRNVSAFKALLIANESRGDQSTGIALEGKIIKAVECSSDFVTTVKDEVIQKSLFAMGHTRFATTGTISKKNAHPFQYGAITGVHNGIVTNYTDVTPEVTVDSEAIFKLLERHKNNYKAVFKRLTGVFAIAWTYKGDLYLVRHDNPLSIAISGDTVFFSSEFYHLYSVMYASGVNFEIIEEIEPDLVYKITPDLTITKEKIKFKKDSYTKVTKTPYSSYYDTDDYKEQSPELIFEALMDYTGCATCGILGLDHGYVNMNTYEAYCLDCVEKLDDKETIEALEYVGKYGAIEEDTPELYAD
jgi:glucosamine 6-phosphate synthetase-like amidotransferase/phosphosugar isomerase protein